MLQFQISILDQPKEEPKQQCFDKKSKVAAGSTASHPDTASKLLQTIKTYNLNAAKPHFCNSVAKQHAHDSKIDLPLIPVTLNKVIKDVSAEPDVKLDSVFKFDKAASTKVGQVEEKGFSMKAYVDEIRSPIIVTRVTLHPDDVVQVNLKKVFQLRS